MFEKFSGRVGNKTKTPDAAPLVGVHRVSHSPIPKWAPLWQESLSRQPQGQSHRVTRPIVPFALHLPPTATLWTMTFDSPSPPALTGCVMSTLNT